jgi:hypothetical protein
LETQGAGVFTFADGRTGDIDFPAFYTRESGVKSPMVVQNEREAAAIICEMIILSVAAYTNSSKFPSPSLTRHHLGCSLPILSRRSSPFPRRKSTPLLIKQLKKPPSKGFMDTQTPLSYSLESKNSPKAIAFLPTEL